MSETIAVIILCVSLFANIMLLFYKRSKWQTEVVPVIEQQRFKVKLLRLDRQLIRHMKSEPQIAHERKVQYAMMRKQLVEDMAQYIQTEDPRINVVNPDVEYLSCFAFVGEEER